MSKTTEETEQKKPIVTSLKAMSTRDIGFDSDRLIDIRPKEFGTSKDLFSVLGLIQSYTQFPSQYKDPNTGKQKINTQFHGDFFVNNLIDHKFFRGPSMYFNDSVTNTFKSIMDAVVNKPDNYNGEVVPYLIKLQRSKQAKGYEFFGIRIPLANEGDPIMELLKRYSPETVPILSNEPQKSLELNNQDIPQSQT